MVTKLAILTSHPIQYYAPVFAKLAAKDGIELHVFYGDKGSVGSESFDEGFGQKVQWDIPVLEGYEHTVLPNHSANPGVSSFSGLDCRDIGRRIGEWNPDALLVYGWCYKSHLRALRYAKGRCVTLFRGDSTLLDPKTGFRKLLRDFWLRWIYRHVDGAFNVGKSNREYFLKYGLRPKQLEFAPHSIDNDRFSAEGKEREDEAKAWRAELGIPEDSVTVLFVGKLQGKKAPDLLLDAFAKSGLENAHLIFAGSGEMEDELKAAAGERVHFVGFQNQSRMPTAYRLGDLLALPSRGPGETWGLAVNEAMACSRPVLVSDRCGCAADLVIPGKTGKVIDPFDVNSVIAALKELCLDRTRLHEMGRESFKLIEDWSIGVQAEQIERGLRRFTQRR